jgi:hypothetical protein
MRFKIQRAMIGKQLATTFKTNEKKVDLADGHPRSLNAKLDFLPTGGC